MNILLVYPKYPDTFWSFKDSLKFISKKAAFPPLGLLTVGAMLPKEWNKKLVDINVNDLLVEDILWADMVFISAMIVQKKNAQEIIDKCNKYGRKVVAGGPYFTVDPEKFTGVDHFVLNEAEVTLPQFLADLEKNSLKKVYTSKERPDITKTPAPLWSLINLKDYASMAIQYSRGCPFNCEFCDIIIMNGRIPRVKTPEQMINEFQSLYDAGWRDSLFIVDDNFIGNKMHAKKMLAELIKWQKSHNYPFKLFTEASTNLADDEELMRLMSAANFGKVFLGIETPNVEGLKECGKYQNVERDLAETVKIIQRNGMEVMGGFILGFDSDTESIFEAQIRFIQKVGIVNAMVGLLNAVPQTRLWHRLKAEGRILGEATGENTDGTLNFVPKIDKKILLEGYKKILSTLYSHDMYYKRINIFLKNYNPREKARISLNRLNAFLKSMWKIGVCSGARKHYWKLMIKTLIFKRKAFAKAVELAIYGVHFRNIAKKISA